MTDVLVGHTGFVGSTLRRQRDFDRGINRANLATLPGTSADLVVCAAAPAAKWLANKDPDKDMANLRRLMNALDDITAERFLLVSTVDVYPSPADVDEDTAIDASTTHAYGRHRRALERHVRERFPHASIVRLPALFGQGLAKNFIYDLQHDRQEVALTHADSSFQFYDMSRLWQDLERIVESGLPLVNLVTEPVVANRVAEVAFGRPHELREAAEVHYDVRSLHADAVGAAGPYITDADTVLEQLRRYAREHTNR